MTRAGEFAVVADVLQRQFPPDIDVSGLEITFDGGRRIVHVRTRNGNRFLVGEGAALESAREALAEQLGDPRLQLNIEEVPPWSVGRPPDHPSGDREPRLLVPPSPSAAVGKDISDSL